jgi:hypothetical protein
MFFAVVEFEPGWTVYFARQALYFINFISRPFCSGYFGDMVSLFAQTGLNHNPPILSFVLSLK